MGHSWGNGPELYVKTHQAFLFAPIAARLLLQFEGIPSALHKLFIPAHKFKALLLK